MRNLMSVAIVLTAGLSASAATWPGDPTVNLPVAVVANEQSVEKMATMPDGTTWIGWFDNRGGSYAVYVQRLLPNGTETFAPGGLLVSGNPQSTSLVDWDLTVDDNGNCLLAFTDTREGGDLDVFAYLISPAGAMLWGANGVQCSTVGNTDFEADPPLLVTSDGDYLVSWPRYGTLAPGLWMQRYDSSGAPVFAAGGVKLAGTGAEVPAFHEWIAVSGNQFVMMWQRDTRTFASPRHVRALRFNADGTTSWGGTPLELSNGNSVPIAHKMKIITDGFDRVGYGWHDGRTGSTRAYVQRTGPAGVLTYGMTAVQVSTAAGMLDFDPAIAFVPGSDDMMAFIDQRNGSQSLRGIVAQRIGPGGNVQFGGSGIIIRPVDSAHEGLLRAARALGGATVVFMHAPNAGIGDTSSELIAMNVDTAGNVQWTTTMSLPPVTKFRLNITNDADDEIRAVWQDGRNDVSDLYAQNINADGTLGTTPPPCPGDANGDGLVNIADLSVLLGQFGSAVAPGTGADYNGDGFVNIADLSVLLGAFGTGCP